MLVLSRTVLERIFIGENIVIELLEIRGKRARLGITAPVETPIRREEVAQEQSQHPVDELAERHA